LLNGSGESSRNSILLLEREESMEHIQIKELVEVIARALAESPDEIHVHEIIGQQISVIELRAGKADLGKIIGKEGRNAHAMRTIVNAAATKLRKRAVLEILE
jgi:uncharacterized protein